MGARAQPGRASPGDLLPVARDELLSALVRARLVVRLASPFLSEEVAAAVAAEAQAGHAETLRLLTAVTERSVATGVLSARGLRLLLDASWEIRSIPNLHAKLALMDRAWGLLGSGNLTGSGIG